MRAAVAFLTPFGGARPPNATTLDWFPVVGACLGLALGGLWWAATRAWPSPVAAALIVAADLVLTGMLHFDGLIDSADGLLAPLTPARRLEVMADPRAGAFGVTAAAGTLLLSLGQPGRPAPRDPPGRRPVVPVPHRAWRWWRATQPYVRGAGGLAHSFGVASTDSRGGPGGAHAGGFPSLRAWSWPDCCWASGGSGRARPPGEPRRWQVAPLSCWPAGASAATRVMCSGLAGCWPRAPGSSWRPPDGRGRPRPLDRVPPARPGRGGGRDRGRLASGRAAGLVASRRGIRSGHALAGGAVVRRLAPAGHAARRLRHRSRGRGRLDAPGRRPLAVEAGVPRLARPVLALAVATYVAVAGRALGSAAGQVAVPPRPPATWTRRGSGCPPWWAGTVPASTPRG